ncbi:MAG: hypothetical protein MN733_36890 [Nitrososphaera sp.]|nr:hypothetical protein [Nitrososphaera sp.]
MYSYEVNLLCDFCESRRVIPEIICSEPANTPEEGRNLAVADAITEGWLSADGKWFCAECVNFMRQ